MSEASIVKSLVSISVSGSVRRRIGRLIQETLHSLSFAVRQEGEVNSNYRIKGIAFSDGLEFRYNVGKRHYSL